MNKFSEYAIKEFEAAREEQEMEIETKLLAKVKEKKKIIAQELEAIRNDENRKKAVFEGKNKPPEEEQFEDDVEDEEDDLLKRAEEDNDVEEEEPPVEIIEEIVEEVVVVEQ